MVFLRSGDVRTQPRGPKRIHHVVAHESMQALMQDVLALFCPVYVS